MIHKFQFPTDSVWVAKEKWLSSESRFDVISSCLLVRAYWTNGGVIPSQRAKLLLCIARTSKIRGIIINALTLTCRYLLKMKTTSARLSLRTALDLAHVKTTMHYPRQFEWSHQAINKIGIAFGFEVKFYFKNFGFYSRLFIDSPFWFSIWRCLQEMTLLFNFIHLYEQEFSWDGNNILKWYSSIFRTRCLFIQHPNIPIPIKKIQNLDLWSSWSQEKVPTLQTLVRHGHAQKLYPNDWMYSTKNV